MMMACAFHGLLWGLGALLLVKWIVRGALRRRYGYGGCGARRFGGPYGGGPWGGGPWGSRSWGHGWDHGEGDAWHSQGWDEDDWGPRRRRDHGPLGWLFRGLETTPEQERVLRETFGELKGAGRTIAGKVRDSRGHWADALEAETFDETLVGSAVADLEHAVDDARKTAIDAFAKVHATLDVEQRKRLARLLRRRGGGFGGGPYRSVL